MGQGGRGSSRRDRVGNITASCRLALQPFLLSLLTFTSLLPHFHIVEVSELSTARVAVEMYFPQSCSLKSGFPGPVYLYLTCPVTSCSRRILQLRADARKDLFAARQITAYAYAEQEFHVFVLASAAATTQPRV